MGDAINWEWMLACARDTQSHLVIVSRDGDFGTTHANRTFLNDYLADEFKNRVGRKLRLTLTPNLIEGLKAASIKVTKREQRAAKATLDDLTAQSQAFVGLSPGVAMGDYYDAWPPPYLQAVLSQRRHFPFGSLETTDTPLPLKVG